MNILVTGAGGQLGCEFRYLAEGYPGYNLMFKNSQELDITNAEQVDILLTEHNFDCIINCAAYTAVDKAEDEAVACDKVNHAGVAILANAAQTIGARLIHFSTDYVFDGTKGTPYTEEDPTSARVIYGITKLASERVTLAKCKQTMVIRTSWLYSSFGHNFVKTVFKHLSGSGKMRVVYDQVGTPTYARDLARFVLDSLQKGFIPGLYHYSNEGVCSWYDFAKMIQRIAGLEGHVSPILTEEYPTRAIRPFYSVLDKTKIKETYHVEIPYWVDSLEECIADIQKDN